MSDWTTPTRLQQEWVACAIAAAASRFVPIPLLDDVVKERATLTAVSRTWQAHGRRPAPGAVGILAGDSGSFVGGLARKALTLPLTLLLYPVRKVVRVVTAVRSVSADLVGVLLLARSVDRCLAAGWFTGTDPAQLERDARLVRRAHDQSVAGVDLRVLEHAVGAGLRQVQGLREAAPRYARLAFGRRAEAGHPAGQDAPPEPAAQVEAGVREVRAVLERPEIARLLRTLDSRFDAALAAATGLSAPGPDLPRAVTGRPDADA